MKSKTKYIIAACVSSIIPFAVAFIDAPILYGHYGQIELIGLIVGAYFIAKLVIIDRKDYYDRLKENMKLRAQ